MKTYFRPLLYIFSFCLFVLSVAPLANAEDIDIFVGDAGGADYPNILIVLDNSANWAANNQGWPDDPAAPNYCGNDCKSKQGYYELKSIKNVLMNLPKNANDEIEANVGLMMFNNSTAKRDGGYIRFGIKRMTQANRQALIGKIDDIIKNFNTETTGASVQYTAALFDAFKYFGGYTDIANSLKNEAPKASPTFDGIPIFDQSFWGSNDADGGNPDFTNAYDGTKYKPPVQTTCGKNYIIFIGNGFPATESSNPDLRNVVKYLNDATKPLTTITEHPVANYYCSGTWKNYNSTCYADADACSAASPISSTSTLYQCAKSTCNGNQKLIQQCTSVTASLAPPSSLAANRYADEFAEFLVRTDVSGTAGQQNVFTYAIDVYKNHPDLNQTALLRNMASYGGGQYYTANNEGAIVDALKDAFAEITSNNSTFASASLPVNATNRTQNENQVFIAMFRPDAKAKPRWFGNLKQYKLINDNGSIELGDVKGNPAVNAQTGFIKDCAISAWTTKSDPENYWESYFNNADIVNRCDPEGATKYSDYPDGPRVEAGAVAQVLRTGNGDLSGDVKRNIYGTSSVASTVLEKLESLTTLSDKLPTPENNLKKWVLGYDVGSGDGATTVNYKEEILLDGYETRATIHGDVVHSRPLPINYGSGNVIVYYGANDGMLRAVDAKTGIEKWAFLPFEFHDRMKRLQDNKPIIKYPNVTSSDAQPKDYFWDGTMGVYQNADNTDVMIYPTMRRGGRMIYGIDVSSGKLEKPAILWKFGCPNRDNDLDCVGGVTDIGQTWSTPSVAFIKGYSETTPVLVVGGGYDKCEDEKTKEPACGGAKGRAVYILNAKTGVVIATIPTTRSVAADVALIDVDNDGMVDFAYAADTGGNIYRINFVNSTTMAPLASTEWASNSYKVAYTNGDGRKFLYPPALLQASGGKVYLAIGSGDRERPLITDYPYNGVKNRFYVFMDDITDTAKYNLDDGGAMFNYTAEQACDATKVLTDSSKKGWFMDLNQYGQGEQTVSSALIVGGLVTFSTNRPVPAASGSCSTVLGQARGYWVNLFNGSGAIGVEGTCDGSRSSIFLGGGLPPSPVLGSVPIDGKQTTVVIAAPKKTGGGINSQYNPQHVKPLIKSKRKAKYWKSSGDSN